MIDQLWNLEEANSRSEQGGNCRGDLQVQPFTSWVLCVSCTQLLWHSKIVLTLRCAHVMWFEWNIIMMSWIIYLKKWDRRSMGGVVKCCKCCNHQDCQHLGWSEVISLSYQQRSIEWVQEKRKCTFILAKSDIHESRKASTWEVIATTVANNCPPSERSLRCRMRPLLDHNPSLY